MNASDDEGEVVPEEEDDGERFRNAEAALESETEKAEVDIPDVPDAPSGEGRPPRMARNPKQPSRAEVLKHRLTHIPYRNWCKACVLARARDNQHRSIQGGDEPQIPRIGIDYAFMTQKRHL